jgi:iron complex outermembrane receptor protein
MLTLGTRTHAAADAAAATEEQAQSKSGEELEEVVVSARRRKETIQETPIAMTALATSQMESVASVNIMDIQGAVPNLVMTQQVTGGNAVNLSLRGLSFADIEKSFDPTVAVVVDGAFIGTSSGQLLDFFDIASIEVLRGPQGDLFGRNTIGGVINIQRTRPTDDYSGKFQLEYGSYGTATGRGVLGLPLIKGLLDAKFFFFHTTTDGYYKNYYTGANAGGGTNANFGASFLLTPNESFNALLTLEKQTSSFDNVVANISKTGELFCVPGLFITASQAAVQCNRNTRNDLYTTFTAPNSSRYSSPAATLEMNWDPGFTHLVSITNYRSDVERSLENVSSFSVPIYAVDRRSKYHQLSQELRAGGNFTPTFDYVVGAYFFDSTYTLNQFTGGTLFGGGPYYHSQATTGVSTSIAGFGDFNWEFVPKWRVNFGGRITHDKKELDTSAPNPVVFEDFGNHSDSWTKFTPKVSVDYRPTSDYMLYGSWSRGYRSGGFSGRGLTPASATTPFNPETVNSYEVGAKTAWFDRRLLFNVAVFYTNYKDIQENITESGGSTGNITIVKNAASAKMKGVELDFTGKPLEQLIIRGSLGYLNSHFSGFTNAEAWSNPATGQSGLHTYDYSGVDLIYAPAWTGSLGADYEIPVSYGKYKATAGYRYIAPYDQQIARDDSIPVPLNDGTTVLSSNDARVRTNVQNLVDASLSLSIPGEHGETEFTVFGRNLADNRGAASAFTVAGLWAFATAREPRVFGVRVGYKF